MTLKISASGELELLRNMLGGTPAPSLTLKLYVNDHVPKDSDTVDVYTEMSTHGYTSRELPSSGWTFAQLPVVAEASSPTLNWQFLAAPAQSIFGYYVVGTVDGILRWAERFDPTFSAELAGDALSIAPKITFSSY